MKKIIFFLTLVYSTHAFAQTSSACLVMSLPFTGNGNDASGNGNNATVHGATLTTDRFGNENSAYYFDGVDDYMDVANAASLNFEGDGTLSLWVKQSGDVGTLLWKRVYSGSTGWTIYFGFENSLISYVNENSIYSQATTTSDVWQHIAVVSIAGTMQLYINGTLVDSKTNATGFEQSTTPLLIGTDENHNYFNGTIDDISIYNCALSSDDILSLYNETPDCEVAAYWPFSGNANDESANANNITIHGPTLTTDRFGNENSAYYFDGVDDYMEVPDASSLDFEGNGTISLWVKQNGDVGTLLWKRIYAGSFGWTLYFGFENSIISYVNGNATYVQASTTSDVWQHVAVVSIAGTMKLYINGILVDSKTNVTGFEKATTPLLIGTDENNNYFNGTIDDISIYACALSSDEIISHYNQQSFVTSRNESTTSYFDVFPNPTKDKITIANHNSFEGDIEVTILNSTGIQVLSSTFANSDTVEIDVSNYAKGIYLLNLQMDNTVITKKIIVH